MRNLKLGVEVVGAQNLMHKDGKDSSINPFVELRFDGQRFRTTVKEKDLNPAWNEQFYFNISDPNSPHHPHLDAYVYSGIKPTHSRSLLGRVRLTGTSFVPYADAVVSHHRLIKRVIFSRVTGELDLKVYLTDDPSLNSSSLNMLPAVVPVPRSDPLESQDHSHVPNATPAVAPTSNDKAESKASVDHSASPLQPDDYALKETSPYLGGGRVVGGRFIRANKPSSTYDLVEEMRYLFVRVVKARELPSMDISVGLDPFVEVTLGNYKGVTKYLKKEQDPVWNQVFAFSKHRIQASLLEVVVKDKDLIKDDFVGRVRIDINEVPARVPPDNPLAPEWYRLEDNKGDKTKGELMLAVWLGTQIDEAFPDAWSSEAAVPIGGSAISATYIRSKVYHSPRLWYVRVNIIEAQDLVVADKNRHPDVHVKAQIGNQVLQTKNAQTVNPLWNEDVLLVAAEPFEDDHLIILTVEDHVGLDKDEEIGRVAIPLSSIEKRTDHRPIHSKWFRLVKPVAVDYVGQLKKEKFYGLLHVRVCLDGGYHVLDESTNYSSDLRPTAKQLWKPPIGVLELGILCARGLHPMKTRDGKGTSDTFCVAKYGHKWARTRTIVNSLFPQYNEQYVWEVYDPATVLTVGVFDNSQLGDLGSNTSDKRIGKVRIRLSTLETGRVYTHSYPLLVLHPSGVKKMGELHLAIRFSCTSLVNMMCTYSRTLLPKMHYIGPLSVEQLNVLRYHAVNIVADRLSRAEPPLQMEVIKYMTDVDSHMWSMRKSKANFFRLMSVFSGLFAVSKWFGDVCMWRNQVTTVLVHVLVVVVVCFPELILATVFLCMFSIGIWNYTCRPRYPPHIDTKLSLVEAMDPDELDEEFDTFPTSRSPDVVRKRYDRLRIVAERIQTMVGDVATLGERVQALLRCRDPRATAIFMIFCLVAALLLCVTTLEVIVIVSSFYMMRHPRFRHRLPAVAVNFFRRLPSRTDSMLGVDELPIAEFKL